DAWRTCNGKGNGRISVGLAPHSIYACTPEMLRRARELASEHGLLLQIHVSETEQEFQNSLKAHGLTPIGYLEEMGFLAPDVIAAHVVWLGDGDLDILRDREVSIAHCVASNLKLGSGVAPVATLKDAGLTVGLGTDGPASNNSLDIMADMKMAALLQKGVNRAPKSMPAADVVAMATSGGAAVLGLGDTLGRLVPGYLADVIVVDATGPHITPFHSNDPTQAYAHLVYCAKSSDVRDVVIDGQIRVRDRAILGLDLQTICDGAQRASTSILLAAGLLPSDRAR
ncbi:MAG: amidohydrolase family protein, partial [Alphaproteobacteria bacterium]|nr:amidohydrolase family protein [Alphaproteobacteria bacterium]